MTSASADDSMAGAVDELAGRLPQATARRVPGDHFTAPASPEFVDLVIATARS